jgi:hypothetical protein
MTVLTEALIAVIASGNRYKVLALIAAIPLTGVVLLVLTGTAFALGITAAHL